VVAIIAVATAGVSLSLRDNSQTALEREAQRLAVLFESARAQSRASGTAVIWRSISLRPAQAKPGLPASCISPPTVCGRSRCNPRRRRESLTNHAAGQ